MGELTKEVLENLKNDLLGVVPKFFMALVVFIIGYFVAKIVAWAVKSVLKKSGVDKLKDKLDEIDFISKSNINFVPSTVLSKTVYYILLLAVVL